MGWCFFLIGIGDLYDLLSFGFLLVLGDVNMGMVMDLLLVFFGMLRKW